MPRPKRTLLSPTATDADGIATTQTITAGSLALILNGTLSTGYDLDAVSVAQTTGAAAALLLDGAVGGAVMRVRGTPERLVLTTTSSNSGVTFAIVGNNKRGDIITETLTGPGASQKVLSANEYWHVDSITSSAAVTGNVTVGVNGVVTFTTPQHVTITTTSDESAAVFTIIGTDRHGFAQTELLTGPNATVTTGVKNFATVTYIANDLAATGVTAGVDGTCESGWYPLALSGLDFNVGLGVVFNATGAMTYTVQHTFDDISASTFIESAALTHNHDSLVGLTASGDGNYTNPPVAIRLDITAFTAGGVTFSIIQGGK